MKIWERLAGLDLSGVAISAAVLDEKGTLGEVGGDYEKVLAARFDGAIPKIHTVVFAERQRAEITAKHPELFQRDDPGSDFRLIFAPTLDDAVEALVADAEGRWGRVLDVSTELARHRDFVGRHWQQDEARSFVDGPRGGYLLFVAGPGYGKSALASELARSLPDVVAFHFIKRGMGDWVVPDRLLGSLSAQLRRAFALATLDAERLLTPAGTLNALLQRASRALPPGGRAVVVVDGLDEVFGPAGQFASVDLPKVLPEGIKVILTSRPGEHLGGLGDPSRCRRINLDPAEPANRADIVDYLRSRSARDGLGLDEATVGRLADAAEGCFIAAVLYLRPDDRAARLAAYRADPSQIPRGPSGWLDEEWLRLINPPAPSAGLTQGEHRSVVEATLGLLATAREPLSHDALDALLEAAKIAPAKDRRPPGVGNVAVDVLRHHLAATLRLARGFFDPTDVPSGPGEPLRFFHTSFPEYILGMLTTTDRREAERLLGRACARWSRLAGPARDYALKHRLGHAIAAGEWKRLARGFADAAYVVARARRHGFAGLHADARAALDHPEALEAWSGALPEFERFLRWRIERLKGHPELYAQELRNEFLDPAPEAWQTLFGPIQGAPPGPRKAFGPPTIAGSGHSGGVNSVSFSADGSRVASGGSDGAVKVWDADSRRLVADCSGHSGGVNSVSFSADGSRLASGGADNMVKVWDAGSGRLVSQCVGHTRTVTSVSFLACGLRVASCSVDRTVKVWEVQTGRLIVQCSGDGLPIESVSFSTDGSRVATSDPYGVVKVWDAESGRLVAECAGHSDFVTCGSFSADSSRIAVGRRGGRVDVWDSSSGRLVAECAEHRGPVNSVSFSEDGSRVATCWFDGTIKVWDVELGRLVAECAGHSDVVTCRSFSADGSRVAVGRHFGTVHVWDSKMGRLIDNSAGRGGWINSVSFSADGSRVAAGDSGGAVKVWDAESGRLVAECAGHSDVVTCGSFSADASRIAVGWRSGRVEVWDVERGRLIAECTRYDSPIKSVSFSRDGSRVATCSFARTIEVWDVELSHLIAECTGHGDIVNSVSFSPDGTRVASGGNDRTVKVWGADSGWLVAECAWDDGLIESVSFSADGSRVAASDSYGDIKVCDAGFHNCSNCDTQIDGVPITSVEFSGDGSRVASGSRDGTVKVWDAGSGRLVADCPGHGNGVRSVAFSPDGSRVASGSKGQVLVHAVPDRPGAEVGAPIVILFEFDVIEVGFSGSGAGRLLVADRVGRFYGYDLDPA